MQNKGNEARQWLIIAVLAAATQVALWLSRSLVQYSDALAYVLSAKSGHDLIKPHHLMFAAALRGFYLGLRTVSDCSALSSSQIHSILWSSVAVVGFYSLLRRLLGSTIGAVLGSFALLTSSGFWTWSTQAEAYIPTLACTMLAACAVVGTGADSLRQSSVIAASAALAAAILFHQAAVLFCVPLAIYLLLAHRMAGCLAFAKIVVVSGTVVLGTYVTLYFASFPGRGLGDFARWLFLWAEFGHDRGWGNSQNIGLDGIRTLFEGQVANLVDLEVFRSFGKVARVAVATAWVAIPAFGALLAVRSKEIELRAVIGFFIAAILTFTLFLLWWLPSLRQFILFNNVALIALAALLVKEALARMNRRWLQLTTLTAGVGLTVAVAAANFAGVIEPQHASRGHGYVIASRINDLLPAECGVIANWDESLNLSYYFNRIALNAGTTIMAFYEGEGSIDPSAAAFEAVVSCYAISRDYMAPGQKLATYFKISDHPIGWQRFINWVMDTRRDAEGRLTSAETRNIDTGIDGVYVLVDRRSRVDATNASLGVSAHGWSSAARGAEALVGDR